MMMRRMLLRVGVIVPLVMLCLALPGCRGRSEVSEGPKAAAEVQYRKDMEEVRKSLKGDIRIKLKKDGKGAYSWEITGRDTQEVIRANATLARRLNEGPKE